LPAKKKEVKSVHKTKWKKEDNCIFTCFVLAPDMRRSVVTIPGCNTKSEKGKKRKQVLSSNSWDEMSECTLTIKDSQEFHPDVYS